MDKSIRREKPVQYTLSEKEYSTLSLWCAVNELPRSFFSIRAVLKELEKLDTSSLEKRLANTLQDLWEKEKIHNNYEGFKEVDEKLKEFRRVYRIELKGKGIGADVINYVLNRLKP